MIYVIVNRSCLEFFRYKYHFYIMRHTIRTFELNAIPISDIQFDPQSRDDIPQVLHGIRCVCTNPETRQAVFNILETIIPPHIDKNNGRPGMALWTILVMGVLRLNLTKGL